MKKTWCPGELLAQQTDSSLHPEVNKNCTSVWRKNYRSSEENHTPVFVDRYALVLDSFLVVLSALWKNILKDPFYFIFFWSRQWWCVQNKILSSCQPFSLICFYLAGSGSKSILYSVRLKYCVQADIINLQSSKQCFFFSGLKTDLIFFRWCFSLTRRLDPHNCSENHYSYMVKKWSLDINELPKLTAISKH